MNAIFLTVLLGWTPFPDEVWPGFRNDGTSCTGADRLPLHWSPTEGVAWRSPLRGYGQSSPVVWNHRVFLTAVDGSNKETLLVLALDRGTGKEVWSKTFTASLKGKNNPMMSRAAPTPVVDQERVYAFFESGDVIALSHDGVLSWQRSLSQDYGAFKNNHGLGGSLAQTEKAVIALVDDQGPSYIVALDKATGKNLWKADRPSRASWTSPTVATLAGKPTLLVSSSGSLTAYDATTGKLLATLEGLVGNNIPSPVVKNDHIVLGAGENRMKPDLAASARSNCCVRLVTHGEKVAFETVWEGKKAISHHASPLIHHNHVYFVTKTGFVHCVDLKTGQERYQERLDNPCWATPIGDGECLYFFGKDGVTTVLKAGPKWEKLATNRLWSASDFAKRHEEAKDKAAATLPRRPEGRGPEGSLPLPKEELEATRYSAVGDVVYGVAAVNGMFLVRTGTELLGIRAPSVVPSR